MNSDTTLCSECSESPAIQTKCKACNCSQQRSQRHFQISETRKQSRPYDPSQAYIRDGNYDRSLLPKVPRASCGVQHGLQTNPLPQPPVTASPHQGYQQNIITQQTRSFTPQCSTQPGRPIPRGVQLVQASQYVAQGLTSQSGAHHVGFRRT